MVQRRIAAALVVLLAACAKESSESTPPPALSVAVSTSSLKADGVAVADITVSGSAKGPIIVSATSGTFANGTSTTTIDGTAGSARLRACDARVDPGCVSGELKISAQDANWAKGFAVVQLYGFESVCTDGRDDNANGAADCADADCDEKACSANGIAGTCQGRACVAAVCASPVTESGAVACSDGADNNCDGRVDCADSACDGAPCKAGSPTFSCRSGQCVEPTSGFGLSLTPARTRMPADGVATAPVVVKVTAEGAAAPGVGVTVTASAGALSATETVAATALATVEAQTDATGTATVYFRAPATPIRAILTAKITAKPEISQDATIDMPRLGAMQISRVQHPVMGTRSSGMNEQNALTVVLLDAEQKPYPDGLAVTFQHQQLGGSEISKPWAMDTSACRGPGAMPPGTCLAHVSSIVSPPGEPDSTGEASVNLYPGSLAGSVTVSATATAGGRTISYTLPSVAVTGAKASGAHISVDCTPKNVPAFTDSDCRKTYYDGPGSTVTCTAYLADRFNNVLGLPEHVSFQAENGASSPPATTVAYDPEQAGDAQRDLGKATGFVAVTGYDLPRDVTPSTAEAAFTSIADLGCGFGVTTQNPRDGFVTVVAMSRGEEGFLDGSNGLPANGAYDEGENFIDLGEPFVDANDNGRADAGEWFLDVNGSRTYDEANGTWDADTVIWAETRVAYTGFPAPLSPFAGWLPDSVEVDSTAGGKTATSADASFFCADERFNPPSSLTSYVAASWNDRVSADLLRPPLAVDLLPAQFAQAYCDGTDPLTRTCGNRCDSAPCYPVTQLTGFAGSATGLVRVTGGSTAGPDTVRVTATLNGLEVDLPDLRVTAR